MPEFDMDSLQVLPVQLWTLLSDPISNVTASLILYGIIAAGLLVVVLLAIMWLLALPDDEHGAEPDDEFEALTEPEGTLHPERFPTAAPRPTIVRPKTARGLITALLIVCAVIIAVWVATGLTTASKTVCLSCHGDSPHAEAREKSPHSDTQCAACHEPGGVTGRLTANVPSRLLHFVTMWTPSALKSSYGAVTQSACLHCHRKVTTGVTVNPRTGIRMSHSEPLAARATCTDCHTLAGGVVGEHNAGMNPCLRCHDSKIASSKCATCHDKKVSAAARAHTTEFQAVQVPEVRCGGCHNQKKECDSCHGVRMPHTKAFMAGSHARAGAVNFWYEGGRTCSKCHTPTRRPCTKCHTELLGNAHQPSMAQTHKGAVASGCDLCHRRYSTIGNRDFCVDVCHTPLSISQSPR